MKNQLLFRMCACRACCVMDVCLFLFLFRFYTCVSVCLQIQGPLWECRSIRSGFCGLSYYHAPLVCVPDVIGGLAVWRYYKPKTKNQNPGGLPVPLLSLSPVQPSPPPVCQADARGGGLSLSSCAIFQAARQATRPPSPCFHVKSLLMLL